ncbi:MAG: hypothetical protein MUP81_02675 [Dehalococcoidia bacterium]|nr:hypothetical protein [Dehalococcoidia bacterium]
MQITIDTEKRCIEAGGIKYSFELFGSLGKDGFPEGTYFQIGKREDGMLLVSRFEPPEELINKVDDSPQRI